jgi:two-component system, LytTR family, response regulator
MTIRTIVVDDEALARRRITRMLREFPLIEVVGECSGGRDAVDAVRDQRPDLLFLDVQMPDLDGFEVLRALSGEPLPAVVFVTAYDRYALQAFEACAIDYVMKPFERDRFARAVDRAVRWIGAATPADVDDRVKRLLAEVVRTAGTPTPPVQSSIDRFLVRRGNRTEFVRAADVDWIESDGNYLRLHVGSANHLVRGTIGECAERLDQRVFVRIHRRYIVNMDRVQTIQPWFGGDYVVQLRTGAKLRLSRTYRERFQGRMLGV